MFIVTRYIWNIILFPDHLLWYCSHPWVNITHTWIMSGEWTYAMTNTMISDIVSDELSNYLLAGPRIQHQYCIDERWREICSFSSLSIWVIIVVPYWLSEEIYAIVLFLEHQMVLCLRLLSLCRLILNTHRFNYSLLIDIWLCYSCFAWWFSHDLLC